MECEPTVRDVQKYGSQVCVMVSSIECVDKNIIADIQDTRKISKTLSDCILEYLRLRGYSKAQAFMSS